MSFKQENCQNTWLVERLKEKKVNEKKIKKKKDLLRVIDVLSQPRIYYTD